MKRTVLVLAALAMLFFLATGQADAKIYTVKKGDNLSKIGKKYNLTWQAIAGANKDKVKNPRLIFPGQILSIPEKGKAKPVKRQAFAAKTDDGYALVKTLGRHVFGKRRSVAKAINKFSLPTEVKKLLIDKVNKGEFELVTLEKGQRYEQMAFENYNIQDKLQLDFPEGHGELAGRYSVEWQGRVYYLDIPRKCDNPSWFSVPVPVPVKIEEPEKPAEPKPPVITPCPQCPPCPEPEPKEPEKPAPVPEPKPEEPEPTPKQPEPPRPKIKEYPAQYESYTWAGHYWALKGGGQSSYYGGKLNIFPFTQETSWGRLREGIGATLNGWDGDNHGFDYRGNRWTLGPVASLTGKKTGTKLTSTIQLGRQKDRGRTGLGYKSGQKTKILYFGESLDLYKVGPFYKVESWLDANIDIGHDKDSSFRGRPISGRDDPAENKTYLGFGNRFYFWKTDYLHGGALGKLDYAVGDHSVGVEGGPFISDNGYIFKAGVTFRNQSNSKFDDNNGNSIGVNFDLDIEKTIRSIMGYMKTRKGSPQKKKID